MKTDFNKLTKAELVSRLETVERNLSYLSDSIAEAETATIEYSLKSSGVSSTEDPNYRTIYAFQVGYLQGRIKSVVNSLQ